MIEEIFVAAPTLPAAYHKALNQLWKYGEETDCPDWNCKQKELSMTMIVWNPLQEPMISRCIPCGALELEQYRQEMIDGILDFEVEKGNWNYTYHQRMSDQISFVVDELRRNPYSRRAVIDIRTPEDQHTSDPACLQHIQYLIRGNELHCKVLFRSNDAVKATFMNAIALIMLQKKIADTLSVFMGTYTHRANSFHCYEKDYPTLKGYVSRIHSGRNLTYEYAEEWQELMEDAKPEIARKVEELRYR